MNDHPLKPCANLLFVCFDHGVWLLDQTSCWSRSAGSLCLGGPACGELYLAQMFPHSAESCRERAKSRIVARSVTPNMRDIYVMFH